LNTNAAYRPSGDTDTECTNPAYCVLKFVPPVAITHRLSSAPTKKTPEPFPNTEGLVTLTLVTRLLPLLESPIAPSHRHKSSLE